MLLTDRLFGSSVEAFDETNFYHGVLPGCQSRGPPEDSSCAAAPPLRLRLVLVMVGKGGIRVVVIWVVVAEVVFLGKGASLIGISKLEFAEKVFELK